MIDSVYNFRCIAEDFEIAGSFNTDTASNLMVVFELCDPVKRKTCKDEEAIKKYLKQSYIATLEN